MQAISQFNDKQFTPSVASKGKEYFLKDQEYHALFELPFGIDIKEVVFVFDVADFPPKTIVKAVNELFNQGQEFERVNIMESSIECESKDGNYIRKHCFENEGLEISTCRYILLKTWSNSDGVRLRSIEIERRVRAGSKMNHYPNHRLFLSRNLVELDEFDKIYMQGG